MQCQKRGKEGQKGQLVAADRSVDMVRASWDVPKATLTRYIMTHNQPMHNADKDRHAESGAYDTAGDHGSCAYWNRVRQQVRHRLSVMDRSAVAMIPEHGL